MQITGILFLAVGALLGGTVAWLLARGQSAAREHELNTLRTAVSAKDTELANQTSACNAALIEVAALRAQMAAEQKAAQEKLDALIAVENSLKTSFEALAGKALDANSERLLLLAKGQLDKQQAEAANALAKKEIAIDQMLKPMQKTLDALSAQSQELEVKRQGAYEAVLTEIKNIQLSHTDLRKETTQLVQALRAPKVRGNWGELQLRKCVEFAGMVQHASFDVEKFVRGEDAGFRPDLVVKLPNGRIIVVDAKTPLDAFLDANSMEDESQRGGKMLAHAARVREHLKDLSSKNYGKQFVESPDFIVCFLPSEVLFSAALEHDPSLIEFSAASNVLLATPTTLIALLKAVSYGWQQAEIAKNAILIRDTAGQAYDKLAGLHGSFIELGKRLKGAGTAYDDMLTKVEGRGGVFSISRKLRELGIGEKELADAQPLGLTTKTLESEDWQPTLNLAASEDKPEKKPQ
jgi:DNA recombination protein RmuC